MTKLELTSLFLDHAGLSTDPTNIKEHLWCWWYNPISSTSLRLSAAGDEFACNTLNLINYKYKLKKDILNTAKMYLWLDRYLTVPFYLPNRSNIIFYGELDATMLALYGGDLAAYLENFTK